MLTRRLGMRLGQLAWGLALGGLVAGGCKSEDEDPSTGSGTGAPSAKGNKPPNAGRGGRAGSGGESGTGDGNGSGGTGNVGPGGAPPVDPLAPEVEITSPVAESDPNGEGVIVDDELDVLCTARPSSEDGAAELDISTIRIELLNADGNVVDTAPGTSTDNDDEYRAHFVTTLTVPDNGVIGFRCQAGDLAARVGSDTVEAFVDHGPIINIIEPAADEHVPLHQPLKIAFSVEEAPVARGDDGAAVDAVVMTLLGREFELDLDDGVFSTSVELDDQTLFSVAPDGPVPIIVRATNQRTPAAVTRTHQLFADVDGTGPKIVIDSPGKVRGGKVDLFFTVTDAQSGVDRASIVVSLNKEEYRYSPTDKNWDVAQNGTSYRFTFDTTQIVGSLVQATVAVTADDNVGNLSPKAAILLYLDNHPPIVDLDPGLMREQDKNTEECSFAFDPVGPLAANDLQTVYQLKIFRALVADQTNTAPGQTVRHYAGTDLDSVELRLQPNVEQGLLIDTNDDGVCDDLLQKNLDTEADLPFLPLKGVPPQGSSYFGLEANEDDAGLEAFPRPSQCKYGSALASPQRLCPPTNNDDMIRVIPWDVESTVPAIFAVGSLEGLECTGADWEIGPRVEEGWICVAARAKDNTGNVGISAPLRLCFDDSVGALPSCLDHTADPPPTCTDGCTLPPRYPSVLRVKQ